MGNVTYQWFIICKGLVDYYLIIIIVKIVKLYKDQIPTYIRNIIYL